ncbi:MAG: hypothetical protein AAGI38_01860 [Bacteroidota bacterium]
MRKANLLIFVLLLCLSCRRDDDPTPRISYYETPVGFSLGIYTLMDHFRLQIEKELMVSFSTEMSAILSEEPVGDDPFSWNTIPSTHIRAIGVGIPGPFMLGGFTFPIINVQERVDSRVYVHWGYNSVSDSLFGTQVTFSGAGLTHTFYIPEPLYILQPRPQGFEYLYLSGTRYLPMPVNKDLTIEWNPDPENVHGVIVFLRRSQTPSLDRLNYAEVFEDNGKASITSDVLMQFGAGSDIKIEVFRGNCYQATNPAGELVTVVGKAGAGTAITLQ